jgi:methyl-accepting chemotaxis protein
MTATHNLTNDRSLRNQLLTGVVLAAVTGSCLCAYFFNQTRSRQLESDLKVVTTEQWAQVSAKFATSNQGIPDLVADNQVILPRTALAEDGFLAIASDKGEALIYSLEPGKVNRENVASLPKLETLPILNAGAESFKTAVAENASVNVVGANLWSYRRVTANSEWIVIATAPLGRVWLETFLTGLGVFALVSGVGGLIVWRLTDKLDPTLNLIKAGSDRLTGRQEGTSEDRVKTTGKIDEAATAFNTLVSQIASQQEKIKTEVALTVQQQERMSQAKASEAEENVIQKEVSVLLDVVSALEDGDLTVQAAVSDRATGLVADTLNRLTEQLANIIAQVLNTAQEVAAGSKELEQMAKVVAQNTVEQAQSVARGEELTEQVANSAQTSTALVKNSNQSLLEVQERVAEGQDAISRLTRSIEVLQRGTGQIVQRMKTLGEFVGLAEQFVQDQGQLASLTQVLAINATLVAARAAEQRDPRQFVGVAREFEAIAGQVNTLATQTNEGLSVLQQRTAQIQSVVSAVDAEIQQLDNLVETLTSGIKRSQQAFTSVQTETEQVVEIGQRVTQSSIEIAKAAASTAKYMGEIAKIADKTADLTRSTKAQAESMGIVAQQLLEGISFFRLPATAKMAAIQAAPRGSSPKDLSRAADFKQELATELSPDLSQELNSPTNFSTDNPNILEDSSSNLEDTAATNLDRSDKPEYRVNMGFEPTLLELTPTYAMNSAVIPDLSEDSRLDAKIEPEVANAFEANSQSQPQANLPSSDSSFDSDQSEMSDRFTDMFSASKQDSVSDLEFEIENPPESIPDLKSDLSGNLGGNLSADLEQDLQLSSDLELVDDLDLDLDAFLNSKAAMEIATVDTNFDPIFLSPESVPAHEESFI